MEGAVFSGKLCAEVSRLSQACILDKRLCMKLQRKSLFSTQHYTLYCSLVSILALHINCTLAWQNCDKIPFKRMLAFCDSSRLHPLTYVALQAIVQDVSMAF